MMRSVSMVFVIILFRAACSKHIDNSSLSPTNKVDTCDAKLDQLLNFHLGSVPQLLKQVADKEEEIKLLKYEIVYAENTSQLVKENEARFIKANKDCQKQLKENDVTAASERKSLLSLTNEIYEKIVSLPTVCNSQQAELDTLKTDLISAKSTIKQLTNQLDQQERAKGFERTVTLYKIKKGLSYNDDTQTLRSACEAGETNVVLALLSLGVSCETPVNSNHATCLLQAAKFNHVSLVKMLVNKQCDVNTRTKSNASTPLIEAAYQGFLDVVRVLAERGADLALRSTNGNKTALGWARHHKKMQVINYLVSIQATE